MLDKNYVRVYTTSSNRHQAEGEDMVYVGVPPKNEYKEIPADIYEVVITGYEPIANRFYDPDKDNKMKATQLQWTFVIRDDKELEGSKLTYFTCSYIGRHPKNKLTNLVKATDKEFDIEVAYDGEEAFRKAMVGKALRVTTEVVEKVVEGETKHYSKISGVLPTKLGDLSTADLLKYQMGATEVSEQPF
jgi:hypothetical protein